MAKLPPPPGVETLSHVPPDIKSLPKGTVLARIYFTGGDHPVRWNKFRNFGPTNARYDHHLPDEKGNAGVQTRSILYCATDAKTCLAEVFQDSRRIDRFRKSPWLVIFETAKTCSLLDLTGSFATRAGASMAINAGNRGKARQWARAFYAAYPKLHGIYYASSMHANAPAMALADRADRMGILPPFPKFNRALADDALLDVMKHAASALGYGLR